jgi:hypothetical protein
VSKLSALDFLSSFKEWSAEGEPGTTEPEFINL